MYTLNKFLGVFSLRAGTIFICTLDLVTSAAMFIYYYYCIQMKRRLRMRELQTHYQYEHYSDIQFFIVIRLIVSGVVLYGVLRKKLYLIFVKIVFELCGFVIFLGVVYYIYHIKNSLLFPSIAIYAIIIMLLMFYFWLVILSYCYELKWGNHPSSYEASKMKAATACNDHMEMGPYRQIMSQMPPNVGFEIQTTNSRPVTEQPLIHFCYPTNVRSQIPGQWGQTMPHHYHYPSYQQPLHCYPSALTHTPAVIPTAPEADMNREN